MMPSKTYVGLMFTKLLLHSSKTSALYCSPGKLKVAYVSINYITRMQILYVITAIWKLLYSSETYNKKDVSSFDVPSGMHCSSTRDFKTTLL